MFLLDDILMAPVRGLHFIASSIHEAVQDEMDEEKNALRNELNDLYRELSAGQITEETFDAREEVLLNQLDQLEALEQRRHDDAEGLRDDDPPRQ